MFSVDVVRNVECLNGVFTGILYGKKASMTFLRSKKATENNLNRSAKFSKTFEKKILPSTDKYVVVVDTPSGLWASNTISPVSSGNVSAIVSTDVPSSNSSIKNSCDETISTPCLYHFPSGFGLPFTFTSNLYEKS